MRFSTPGGEVVIPVRWFFSDDLPFLLESTPYGSIQWKSETEQPPDGPGEVVGAARPWRNGKNVTPDCCPKQPRQRGGAAAGGSALYSLGFAAVGQGGIELGGAGAWGSVFASAGGVTLSGGERFGVGYTGLGGLLLNGAGTFAVGSRGQGGVSLNGMGGFGSGSAGDGGLSLDGAGDFGSVLDPIRIALKILDDVATGVAASDDRSINLGITIMDAVTTSGSGGGDDGQTVNLGIKIMDAVTTSGTGDNGLTINLGIKMSDAVVTN